MKAHKKETKITMEKYENPVDFFRRIRRGLLAEYDNDISKYMDSLREEEKKYYEDRLINPKSLPKKESK